MVRQHNVDQVSSQLYIAVMAFVAYLDDVDDDCIWLPGIRYLSSLYPDSHSLCRSSAFGFVNGGDKLRWTNSLHLIDDFDNGHFQCVAALR